MLQKGYSLIELFICLVIMGIFLTTAAVSWHTLISHSQTKKFMNQLLREITLARQEAMQRRASVILCKSQDGMQCSGNWDDGQLLFVEQETASKKRIVGFFEGPPAEGHLRWQGGMSGDSLRINEEGRLEGGGGTFFYSPPSDKKVYKLIISATGRGRIE